MNKRYQTIGLLAIFAWALALPLAGSSHDPTACVMVEGRKTTHFASFGQWTQPPAGEEDEPQDDDEALEEDDWAPAPKLKKLTSQQINRIRYMELRGMRLDTNVPDRVSVKIPKDTIDDFLLEMEGRPGFRRKKDRRTFLKMTAPQKLHVIAKYQGSAFADKVDIRSDPEVFVRFRKIVMPIVLRGCATTACHSSSNRQAFRFRLSRDPKHTASAAYANFIILNDLEVGTHRILDRGQPDQSLLMTYLLPKNEVRSELRHPGDVNYKPIFTSRKARRYQQIIRWISSLKHPAEDYGVHLIPKHRRLEDDEEDAPSPSDSDPDPNK